MSSTYLMYINTVMPRLDAPARNFLLNQSITSLAMLQVIMWPMGPLSPCRNYLPP